MRNTLNALAAKKMKMGNPMLRGVQKASEEARERVVRAYESERAQLLAMQRAELGLEDENVLMMGERKRAELTRRQEIGRTEDYLIKKGYPRTQARALAVAFGAEMAEIKSELSSQLGEAKAKEVIIEMREKLIDFFRNSHNMAALIKDVRTQEKSYAQSILAQVRDGVFERHGLPTE